MTYQPAATRHRPAQGLESSTPTGNSPTRVVLNIPPKEPRTIFNNDFEESLGQSSFSAFPAHAEAARRDRFNVRPRQRRSVAAKALRLTTTRRSDRILRFERYHAEKLACLRQTRAATHRKTG
jgi:hypothetical protein